MASESRWSGLAPGTATYPGWTRFIGLRRLRRRFRDGVPCKSLSSNIIYLVREGRPVPLCWRTPFQRQQSGKRHTLGQHSWRLLLAKNETSYTSSSESASLACSPCRPPPLRRTLKTTHDRQLIASALLVVRLRSLLLHARTKERREHDKRCMEEAGDWNEW